MVDTVGLPLARVVTGANVNDKKGGDQIVEQCKGKYPLMKKVLVDGGYGGEPFGERVKAGVGWTVEVVERDEVKGFVVKPFRWVVERTFGWMDRWRRLAQDYEFLTTTSEAMMDFVLIQVMVGRLARNGKPKREVRKKQQTE